MNFKLEKETPFARKMVKLIQEDENKLIRKSDVKDLVRMYFQKRLHEGRCVDVGMGELYAEITQLLDDLPAYNLQKVTDQLTEKRQYSAVEIVRGGWDECKE